MRRVALASLALFAVGMLCAQNSGTGTIDVHTVIKATAGTGATAVSCVGTPGQKPDGVSTMHMECFIGDTSVHVSDDVVPSSPGTGVVYSITHAGNSVTWILTKGNPAPDGWQVAANGTSKTGTF